MKKLIFVFVALFTLVLISGCGTRQNTIRYNNGSESGEKAEGNEITKNISESDKTDSETADKTSDKKEDTQMSIPTGKLAVTSFDGAFLKTKLSYNVVRGTTSSDTHKITINDYKLQKYIPGQTQWNYIATTRFNTLKDGLNSYIVKTFDADDEQINSLIFSIDYDAPVIPETLPGVGSSHWLALLTGLIMTGIFAVLRKYKWL